MDHIIREKKSQPQSRRYFTKETDINDKRKFIISPTNITIEEFEKWSLIFRGF
mgnify:CR=1 FL=1